MLSDSALEEKIEHQREVQMYAGSVGTQTYTVLKNILCLVSKRAQSGEEISYNYATPLHLYNKLILVLHVLASSCDIDLQQSQTTCPLYNNF